MFFQQFYLPSLGHASYLIGDEGSGRALLWDPRRDVDDYLAAARARGLRIAYAADSHGHNDYLTGIRELPPRMPDVEVLGAATGDLGYDHRPVKDGEVLELGDQVAVEVLHTPGHTPEHISLLVHDRGAGTEPVLLLSGGALLVGDLARPDLLGSRKQAREAARAFCHTLRVKVLPLPDHVQVFPTHVAGSLCGGNIGSRLSTTVGYERRTNRALSAVADSERFVAATLSPDTLPAVPPYWRRMRARNLAGPEPLGVLPEPPALTAPDFDGERQADRAVVLDARAPEAFGGGHVPGALSVGLGSSFPTWAGTLLPADARILLVLDDPADLWEATWQLLRIGYDPPAGWLAGGMQAWRTSGRPVDYLPQLTPTELRTELDSGAVRVLDVRQPSEWAAGHIDGAVHVTGAELPERMGELGEAGTSAMPLAVVCGSGYRSTAAASLLAAQGNGLVFNVMGGMSAWQSRGYPTTAGSS